MEKKTIKTEVINRLRFIFRTKEWNIDDELFENYCKLLGFLNEKEIDLILRLTEDYLHCKFYQYEPLIKNLLKQIIVEYRHYLGNIFLLPLIKFKDIGSVKSGNFLLYPAKIELEKIIKRDKTQTFALENPNLLKRKHSERKNSLILLLDDFIGTGNTAEEAIDFYYNEIAVQSDKIIIAALVAQDAGVKKISDLGIEIYVAIRRKKGITESERLDDIDKAVKIMEELEEKIGVDDYLRFGYKRSEALVTMLRTPNNTFPVFWHDNKANGSIWPAPFRR